MKTKTPVDAIVRTLREIDDPNLVYVGRRTDKRQLRVQIDVTAPLARKLIPVILEDAAIKRRRASKAPKSRKPRQRVAA